jgi:hypothetical protein
MYQTQQNTTRATGKRAVRPPLRFSNQVEFIPSKFGVTVDGSTPPPTPTPIPSTNDSWGDMVNSEDDTALTILNDSWGYIVNSEDTNATTIVNEVPGHTSGPKAKVTFADVEMVDAVDALVSMKISGKNAKLNTHGKFCGECGELSLGCEQDASDMEWYCQPCWKSWTDNYLSCPYGIVEYHELKVDYSNEDSWYPSVTDEVVYAEQIDFISEKVQVIKEATVIHDESTNDLSYSECTTDEYAIVSRAYPNGSGIAIESVYLILSTGTVYPIEGDQNPNSSNYNPIIDEVVGNLKRILNGNDDYDNYEGVY